MSKIKKITKSATGRFMEITGLMTKVGSSVLGNKTLNTFRDAMSRDENVSKNMIVNAHRIVETLGRMKGGAMKIGQMLSLQEGLLPPEIARILSALQNSAPPVEFDILHDTVKRELGEKYDQFESIDPIAYASASIGQVHRARLKNGHDVVIKIQYPDIDKVVMADLKNLKGVMSSLFQIFVKIDFETIWDEFEERLMEEVDYENESRNLTEMKKYYNLHKKISMPSVYGELTSKRVITLEFLPGISPERIQEYPESLRNQWAASLSDFLFTGLFDLNMIHADPNFANFSFKDDGGINVYDFGCIKRLEREFMKDYARVANAIILGEREKIPELLKSLGVTDGKGNCLARDMVDPFIDVLSTPLRKSPPYDFTEGKEFFARIIELKNEHWKKVFNLKFHRNFVFLDRTLSGHFGNLSKLEAKLNIHDLILEHTRHLI